MVNEELAGTFGCDQDEWEMPLVGGGSIIGAKVDGDEEEIDIAVWIFVVINSGG